MPNEIKVGDVVQLKSGGPKMTVNWIEKTEANCSWFLKDAEKKGTFPLTSLTHAMSGIGGFPGRE